MPKNIWQDPNDGGYNSIIDEMETKFDERTMPKEIWLVCDGEYYTKNYLIDSNDLDSWYWVEGYTPDEEKKVKYIREDIISNQLIKKVKPLQWIENKLKNEWIAKDFDYYHWKIVKTFDLDNNDLFWTCRIRNENVSYVSQEFKSLEEVKNIAENWHQETGIKWIKEWIIL